MSMFGPKMGTYWIRSDSDPRFNESWRKEGLCCWGIPDWIMDWINQKTKDLALEDFPDDLTWGFMKD